MSIEPALAFVFPGQGSQSVGMLADVAATRAVVRDTFAEAGAALGRDLWQLVQQGPDETLNLTTNTQPALLTASVALWRAWLDAGGATPAQLSGHSLGEYSALVCAGALRLDDAVRLVSERGRCMQAAVPAGSGAMAAILGLDDAAVVAACAAAAGGEIVSAVNFNAPGQVVIAGERAAVERAIEACKAAGARRAMPLPISVPSHCALMRPAAETFRAALAAVPFADSAIPVIQNVDAVPRTVAADLRAALVLQLYSPVRWVQCVQALRRGGASRIVECGPGRVLAGLVKRIDAELQADSIGDDAGMDKALKGGWT